MRQPVLLFLFLTASSTFAFGMNDCVGTFEGVVLSEDGEPLPGATVVLTPGGYGQVTDAEGKFFFNELCQRTFKVKIQFLGHEDKELEIDAMKQTSHTIYLKFSVKNLKEIVVQGQSEHVEHAQNYVTLGQKDLAKSAGKTLGEALNEASGVSSIQAGPGIFKPAIHGVHSTRVLILNHGIRQEGQQWGAEHAPEVDPNVASELIVIKDASAIKYGADALGGVILVNPAALPETANMGGAINMITQSNGRSGIVSGMLEGGIKSYDGWGWRLQGTAKRAGDYHAADYQLTNTGVKELDFSGAAGYHGEKFGADVFYSRFSTEIGILKGTSIGNVEDLLAAMDRETPLYTGKFSYAIDAPRQKVAHNLIKINGHADGEHGDWHIQYGFQNNSRREFDIRRGGLTELPAIDLRLQTHTLEAEWETAKADSYTLCFGFNSMIQANDNIPGTQRIPFIPNFTSFSGGPFAVGKFFLDQWTLDVGARYDVRKYNVAGFDFKNTRYSSQLQFGNVSGTLGAAIRLNDRNSFSMNVSSAWRPPHVAELYSLGTHQSAAAIEYGLLLDDATNEVIDLADANFKIETAWKAVATWRAEAKTWSAEATAYSNYIANYIYLRPTGVTENVRGVYPYFRYAQTDALFVGADLSGKIRAGNHFTILPKASLIRATDVTNKDYLVFIPSNKAELALRYERDNISHQGTKARSNKSTTPSFGSFFVEVGGKYVFRQTRAPRVILVREFLQAREEGRDPFDGDNRNFDFMAAPEGYFLLNASVGASISTTNGRYDFRLSGENVLNNAYREYLNRFRYYADDLGRNISVSAKYIF
jgi:iron complex outermembrane receptor protein